MSTLTAPILTGQRVYFVGHSFHLFVVAPLIKLAKEAGITGHWAEGWDMIGGSTATQHWERDGEDNAVRAALATGRVQVLTLASNVINPEPAIDLFADAAVAGNPDVRVLLQHSWGDEHTGKLMRARHRDGAPRQDPAPTLDAEGRPVISPERRAEMEAAAEEAAVARDAVTAADLQAMRVANAEYRTTMRDQLRGINARHGRTLAHVVPVNEAVLRLREAVVAGEVPGVDRQSALFRDALGHATEPTMHLVTYAWLACLYRVDPRGRTALVEPDADHATAQHRVLQEIAWGSVLDEPMSGVDAGR